MREGPRGILLGPDTRRSITALLRERAHRLPRVLPARLTAAVRLLPALLHASFEQSPFDVDAPGLAGLRYRRRWSSLARLFAMPPPCRVQRGPPLVDALLVIPSSTEIQAFAIAAGDLSAEQRRVVEERLAGIQQITSGSGAPVRATVLEPQRIGSDVEACHRLIAFGALLAGRLPTAAWRAFETARGPLPAAVTSVLAAGAPSPLATLALTLLTRAPCPDPLEAVVSALAAGVAPRHLADPETFCVHWAGLVPGLRPLLDETRRLTARVPPQDVRGPRPAFPGDAALGSPSTPGDDRLARLVAHGRALAHACATAIRASRLGRDHRFTERLWREALGPGMPRVLLPALGACFADEAAAGRLTLHPTRVGHAYEVRLPGGTTLGRGASPVQARVRALGLVAAADAARSGAAARSDPVDVFSGLDGTWREVGRQLSRAREHPTLILVLVSGGGARPGPPMDLLNRGPARSLEFDGALAVLLVPGRRPSGNMLSPEGTIEAVLRRAPAGAALELLAAQSNARPVAARLAHIAALLRDPSAPGPVAVEAGGRVLMIRGHGVRAFPLARFASRPRAYTPDPDAPDISVSTGQRQSVHSRPSGLVQCRVTPVNGDVAALLYADGAGVHLREEVALAEVEERLREAREIVRAATPPAALAVRPSDDLEPALRRAGLRGARIGIVVGGALPFVEVDIDGERFGGASALGWRAAAEALLARWPAGGEGGLSVIAVTATARGARPSPLLALYASSVARRRLRTHVVHALASYRTAAESRRGD